MTHNGRHSANNANRPRPVVTSTRRTRQSLADADDDQAQRPVPPSTPSAGPVRPPPAPPRATSTDPPPAPSAPARGPQQANAETYTTLSARSHVDETSSTTLRQGISDTANPNGLVDGRTLGGTIGSETSNGQRTRASPSLQPVSLQEQMAALQQRYEELRRTREQEIAEREGDQNALRAVIREEERRRAESAIATRSYPTSISYPSITATMRGNFRPRAVREVLGLDLGLAAPEDLGKDDAKEFDDKRSNLWKWLQSTARLVVAWSQDQPEEELRVEAVPAWQTMTDDQRSAVMDEFVARILEKPSAKALFFYGDPFDGRADLHSVFAKEWPLKEMIKTVMNDITDTDTRHRKLDEYSTLTRDSPVIDYWPPGLPSEMVVAVQHLPAGVIRRPRGPRRRRNRRGQEQTTSGESAAD